ncbi:YafY family transcriptional regulator [Rhizobium sp. DKSPLA3]|uniref:YafY family transcriptional regulator n=1 Tax=Rhizobium quercicola TaxID=2901226 RepID=A0A9X1T2R4_9HYPH|nr:YafY family protein [Rhizobium quercicola]MCD7111339.1 YafY family transcriptional regulator [Rhizobium quercicola]
MLGVLRARRRPVTALELAQALGISERSVYRDVDTLRQLGAPLDGQAGVGFLLRDGFFLPNFAFSPEEIHALILGLGWVQQRADPALVQSSESALAKIRSSRTDRMSAGDETPALVTAASLSERSDPTQVAALRDAIRGMRKVALAYEDAAGSLSQRIVWPITIVYFDDVRVLAAWCESRSAFRHFRVDRVRAATVLAERYPERRAALIKRWREQDRDWRSLMTGSDGARG